MRTEVIKERLLKRLFDLLISAFLVAFFSPLFILIAVLLKMEGILNPSCRGPVFFDEIRVSRGRRFSMYKFRTVKSDILELLGKKKMSITDFTSKRDKNKYLTPVGNFLATTYFDELPQLYNVLKGEMSMVGPRPHTEEHYESDLREGAVSAKYIKTGLMGLAQASKGNPAMRDAILRMAAKYTRKDKAMVLTDRLYLQKYLRSSAMEMLVYDMGIAFQCLRVVLAAKGI